MADRSYRGGKLNIEQLRNLRDAYQVSQKLNDTAKQCLVILLMDDLKSYTDLTVDPRAARLVYNHEYHKAHSKRSAHRAKPAAQVKAESKAKREK